MSLRDLSKHVENVMKNPGKAKDLGNGRKAYMGRDGTVVIHNPMDDDLGTVFKPKNPDEYWEGLS
jgi:hypothetical protein